MMQKLAWEIKCFEAELRRQDATGLPRHLEAAYCAFNVAVTAWHLSDWTWHSLPEHHRPDVAEKLGASNKLKSFQDALIANSRALRICKEIANGSKHMEDRETDIRADIAWTRHSASVGQLKAGQPIAAYNFQLIVFDGSIELDAAEVFSDVFSFWRRLLPEWGFLDPEFVIPDEG
jgi:hypothetical protein